MKTLKSQNRYDLAIDKDDKGEFSFKKILTNEQVENKFKNKKNSN